MRTALDSARKGVGQKWVNWAWKRAEKFEGGWWVEEALVVVVGVRMFRKRKQRECARKE